MIEKIKDKIYKTNESILLREKFYELKSCHELNLEKAKNGKKTKQVAVDLDENIEKVIKEMLLDLRENIYSILEASNDIARIFKPILLHLINDENFFNFEDIHREEFSNSVKNDEFLEVIFLQIKNNSNNPSYEELYDILCEIEDILKVRKKEMTKFKNFIDIGKQKVALQIGNNNDNTKNILTCHNCASFNLQKKNHCHHNIRHTYHNHQNQILEHMDQDIPCGNYKKSQNLNTSTNSSAKKEKDKFKDIDDLLDYINANEGEAKPKKHKKKNNKKEKKNNLNITNNNITNSPQIRENTEKEIEDFKINIKNNSINAYSIRKIKPNISKQFLMNLAREVKSI